MKYFLCAQQVWSVALRVRDGKQHRGLRLGIAGVAVGRHRLRLALPAQRLALFTYGHRRGQLLRGRGPRVVKHQAPWRRRRRQSASRRLLQPARHQLHHRREAAERAATSLLPCHPLQAPGTRGRQCGRWCHFPGTSAQDVIIYSKIFLIVAVIYLCLSIIVIIKPLSSYIHIWVLSLLCKRLENVNYYILCSFALIFWK